MKTSRKYNQVSNVVVTGFTAYSKIKGIYFIWKISLYRGELVSGMRKQMTGILYMLV